MILSLKSLMGYKVRAIDNDIGEIRDFYIDKLHFKVRYAVLDLGPWLPKPPVLVSPAKFGRPDGEAKAFPTSLTVEEIKRHPGIRNDGDGIQDEHSDAGNWKIWRPSWDPEGMPVFDEPGEAEDPETGEGSDEPPDMDRLQGTGQLMEYSIHATDGEIGVAEDFIVETDTWILNYLVINTGKWLPGKSVIVSVSMIRGVEEAPSQDGVASLHLGMAREDIRESPEYDPNAPVNREQKTVLYDYHGRRVGEE
jgi:hypothetical protein